MSAPGDNHERLAGAVATRQQRRDLGRSDPERSLGRNLALIGAVGWTIVVPTLAGIAGGRWLDRRFDAGVFWTLGLLAAGLTLGCVLAWKRIHSE